MHYQPGDKIFGHYLVHQALRGGMGEVYLCLSLDGNIPFALKTLPAVKLTDRISYATFEREIATWIALEKHPNIVRCFFMQQIDNLPFMFLEWVAGDDSRGTDLRSWLRPGPLDLQLALDFTIDICRGLIHANQKQPGLVHRDLKPENVLVSQDRVAKITDFGLANIYQQIGQAAEPAGGDSAQPEATGAEKRIAGTPLYMAPEQWQGETLDTRTDLYAVGCILFELISGRPPFSGRTLSLLRQQHLTAPVPKLAGDESLAPFDDVLSRCLAKSPANRFENPEQLLQAVEQLYHQYLAKPPRALMISEELTALDYSNRGGTYLKLKQYSAALADLNRALELEPQRAHSYAIRGAIYEALTRYEEALADLDRAIELDPQDYIAFNNRGNVLSSLKRYDEAIVAYSQAVQLEPAYANAFYNRGNAYRDLERYEEALADYNRAIALEPYHSQAYSDRGNIYREQGRYQEALAEFERAIELNPAYAKAYLGRGLTLSAQGQPRQAIADFDRAIDLDPDNIGAYNNRASVLKELQNYDAALADYDRALRLNPADPATYFNRGLTYNSLKDYDRAISDFSQVLKLDSTDAQAYNMRGNAFRDSGRFAEALADYSQAIALDPAYPKPYYNRGLLFEQQERYQDAAADFLTTTQLAPTFAPAHLNLGVMLAYTGAWSEALQAFEQAVALGFPGAKQYAEQARAMLEQPTAGNENSSA